MTQTEIRNAEQAVNQLLKRQGNHTGAQVINDLAGRTKGDPSAAQFAIGDEIVIPSDDTKLFKSVFNGTTEAYGVVCSAKTAAGVGAKALFFSALDRGVAEYGANLQPTGNIVYAKSTGHEDVYNKTHDCTTDLEVWNAIKGKTLKVVALNPVKAARYRDGMVVGTRDRKIAVFEWA